MTLTTRQESLVSEFAHIDDLQERLAAVVDRARRHTKLGGDERIPANRVPGCASQVWLMTEFRGGLCHFRTDADSPVVRGLVALIADFYSDATPAEILGIDADPVELLGLSRTLSPTRRHGLAAVRATIRAFAQQSL